MKVYQIALWILGFLSFAVMLIAVLDLFPSLGLQNYKFIAGMQFIVLVNFIRKYAPVKKQIN